MKRIITNSLIVTMLIFIGVFYYLFFSARPPLMTDAATLAGDGSLIDYCAIPTLDGTGLTAAEIPKGNTPACAYTHFPLPILAACTEPLIEGADDIRGLWRGITGDNIGHIERIEQCGNRTVITTSGVIHDAGPNSTGGIATNDTLGAVIFSIGDKDYCPRTSATMEWDKNILNFHAFGWGPVVVRRYRDGEHLIWEYANGDITRHERICTLPATHKKPRPRGPRLKLF